MPNKRRILILCTSLWGGGAEKVISLISQKLDCELLVAVFNKKEKTLPYGGHLVSLDFKPTNNLIKKITNAARRVFIVKKLKKRFKPDTCISFMQSPNVLNLLTKGKEKTIISIRNYDSFKYRSQASKLLKFEYALTKALTSRSDLIVVVSKELINLLIEDFSIKNQDKVVAIQNGCDISKITLEARMPLPPDLIPLFNNKVIINVGKLEYQKGQEHLIQVFGKLYAVDETLKLIILGQGSLKEKLISDVTNLGLKAYDADSNESISNDYNVYFLGFQNNPYPTISKASLFVFSSLYEGFPNALLEAMACGIPVVSADCSTGPKEILQGDKKEEKYGVLLPNFLEPNDGLMNEYSNWCQEIFNLLKSEDLLDHYRELSSKRIATFSLERMIEKWEKIV